MNCLVMGGAGFIGSHIVDALIVRDHKVRVFDLPNVSLQNLKQCRNKIEVIHGDFNNISDIETALENIQVVVHLVCMTLPASSNKNPIYDIETNVVGTLHLLEKAVSMGIRKIVFSSSGGTVYGIPQSIPISENHQTNPLCSYGISKLTIEKYLALYKNLYNLDYVVLRLSNPFGERQRVDAVQGAVAVFLGKLINSQPISIWGDGSVARDYFYISDLVSAFVKVIEQDTPSQIYNIGSGKATSLIEILSVIENVTGKKPDIRFYPARNLDVPINCLDISRAKQELEWMPKVSLEQGIQRVWEWLTSQ